MPVTLSAKERAHLKARAHALEPVVQVGQAGLTPELTAEVDRSLTAHELIKVRIGAADRHERERVGEALGAAAAPPSSIGSARCSFSGARVRWKSLSGRSPRRLASPFSNT